MTSYLYAVQDDTGREVVSAHVDVEKVSDVHAQWDDRGVFLMFEDVEVEVADYSGDGPLTLYRWKSIDKLGDPVEHAVARS